MSTQSNTTPPTSDSAEVLFISQMQGILEELMRNFETCERYCVSQLGVTVALGNAVLAMPTSGPITMNDLSERTGLAQSTMTRTVDQLVEKGLAQRRTSEEDRREVHVQLTAQGSEVQQALESSREQVIEVVRGQIPAGEHAAAIAVLSRVSEAFHCAAKDCCS